MSAPQEQLDLVERIRVLLAERVVREVSMFGGRAFMVDERLAVSAGRRGDLLVRVPAERHEEFLDRPGAEQAVMGKDRTTMGEGWVNVLPEALVEDADLAWWVDAALAGA